MGAEVWWISNFLLTLYLCSTLATSIHKKFEYKYSFKPPYLAQKDGSVPFWEYGGNAIASAENVRVAPSLRSQKGAIWTKTKTSFDWWEVDLVFRITGRGRIGADGLAFWFVENKGAYDGPVYGSSDKWVGLGVFFDSFDNDNKHNNPYIMAMANDGTREYDHSNDGGTQILSGCIKDFRNKPFPTRAKIEYYMNTLTVLFHNGMTNSDQDYEICLRVENLYLPKTGYFGVSAATGGLADDHDVLHFLTTSLYAPGTLPPAPVYNPASAPQKMSQDEETKLAQEYQEYQKKLDQQQEEYRKDHPEVKEHTEDWYESDDDREFRQLLSAVVKIQEDGKVLGSKLDEMLGKQERTLGLISSLHTATQHIGSQQGLPPPSPGQPIAIDSIRRHEVDAVLANQNSIIAQSRELRGFLVDISQKTDTLLLNKGTATPQNVQDTSDMLREVKESIGQLKQQAPQMAVPIGQTCPNCVTPLILFLSFFGHLVVMFIYLLYRDNKGQQAKKFY